MMNNKVDLSQWTDDKKYTKGMCYALCEFLESLCRDCDYVVDDIYNAIGYEKDTMIAILQKLDSDINNVICDEQDERDDTDSMAQIMEIKHISGEDDKKGVVL